MADATDVWPTVIAIPAGGDAQTVRLSLRVTPRRPIAGEDLSHLPTPIPLGNWPTRLAALAAKGIQIRVAAVTGENSIGAETLVTAADGGLVHKLRGAVGSPPNGAVELWTSTFDAAAIKALAEALGTPSTPPDPDKPTSVSKPMMAPRIDVKLIGDALVKSRGRAAAQNVAQLLGERDATRDPGLAPPAELYAGIAELEAWAIPGTAKDPLGKIRERVLLAARAKATRGAVGEILSDHFGSAPAWGGVGSHAMLDALCSAYDLEGRPDPVLAAAVLASKPTDPNELLASRMKSLMLAMATTPAEQAEEAADDPPKQGIGEIERRKLAAILSYPTIARYLGMAFEVEVPRTRWEAATASLGARATGAVRVCFGQYGFAKDDSWTAYLNFVPGAGDGRPAYFGPADIKEAVPGSAKSQKFVHGMLDLKAKMKGATTGRYSLTIVDAVNSAMRQSQFARELLKARRTGIAEDTELPELGGRGVALLDHDWQVDEGEAKQREGELMTATTKLMFAQDLVVGYRPAIGVCKKGSDSLSVPFDRWRSLVARTVAFDNAIDPNFAKAHNDPEREHGHTRSPVGRQKNNVLNHSELFVWTGENLAVAPPHDGQAQKIEIPKAEDLHVGIKHGLHRHGAGPGLGQPPLRDGLRYVVGMSAMFPNGCGPTIEASIAAHSAKQARHLLGDQNGRAFRFTRCERIPPPVVLLRAGTPIVTRTSLDSLPGQSLTTLVVRKDHETVAQRYLFPERIEFDRAEQQGAFSRKDQQTPAGAFQRIEVNRHKESGAFPFAIRGQVVHPKENRVGTITEPSRGPVLEFVAPPGRVDCEYYPDGYCKGVWAHLSPVVPSNGRLDGMKSALSYRRSSTDASLRPVMLELARVALPPGVRGRVDIMGTALDQPNGVSLPKLSIQLAPATSVDVELVSDFDAETLLTHNLVAGALAEEWGDPVLRDAKHWTEKLAKASAAGRIKELQGVSRVRLVHAVQRPLKVPLHREIAPVMVTLTSLSGGKTDWDQIATANQDKPFDEWSVEGGGTCLFVGTVGIDAPSTGVLSLDASWHEYGPEMLLFDKNQNPPWSLAPARQVARLFTAAEIASATSWTDPTLLDDFDLLGPQGARRALAFTFRDGRARCLDTHLLGVSRFVDYYPKVGATSDKPGGEGKCEKVSAVHKMWVPCAYRPAPLDVKRITAWFEYTVPPPTRQMFEFERRTKFRLELGRDCYTSGEGEMVGLVFNDAQPPVCNYSDEVLRPFAAGVTRWGRDPLFDSPVPAVNLTAQDFIGKVYPKLKLLPGADPISGSAGGGPSLAVSAIGAAIELDRQNGEFYCDIAVADAKGRDVYMPFVQLGLTRFQRNAIKGLELSLPVGHTVQILPRRSGSVKFRTPGEGKKCRVRLRGPMAPKATLDLTALRWGAGHWVPLRKDFDGPLAQQLGIAPTDADGWDIDFDLLVSRLSPGNHLGLLIEEHEHLVTDDGELRRLVFGHIVDFGEARSRIGPASK